MRTPIAVVGLLALLVPAVATAQDAPPPMVPATSPPPTETAPPPPPPMAAPTPVATTPMVSAAPTTAPSMKGFSLWGIWGWGGLGGGARFMIPLGMQPLLQNTNLRDNFALEFGADFTRWSYDYGVGAEYSYSRVVPVFGAMWMIWFNPQFALYPKVEAGYAIGWWTGWDATYGVQASHSALFIDGVGGLLYKLNNGLTLRAETGYTGLKLGIGFLF